MGIKVGKPFKIVSLIGLILSLDNTWSAEPQVPASAVFPETMSKALQSQQPTLQSAPLPPVAQEEKAAPSGLAEQAKKITFQLNDIVLVGNKTYTKEQLLLLYKDKLHKVITVADLFGIVQSITNYYRNSGYIISRAILPPQHVKGGVVQVQIIEGYIDKVDVTGKPRRARCIVQAFGRDITECRPLRIDRMEKYLLLANELPGTEIKAVLAPSKTETGAADLSLVTTNKPFFGYFSYDNYGTRFIGPQQDTGNIGFTSFLNSGDAGQLTFTKTPRGIELTYTDVNYSMPVDDRGERLLLGGTRTHTHPLFILEPLNIDGVTNNYYTTAQYPIIRNRTENLTLRSGFNYLDTTVNTFGFQLYTDHVRSLDLGATYNFTDSYMGSNMFSGDFRQGLPILGYTSNQNPDTAQTSRPGGRGDYTKLFVNVTRLQGIYKDLYAYGIFQGQWAANPLLASEQFTFGGSQLGRGYDIAELIGDKGIAGSVELRYNLNINKFFFQTFQLYAYYDAGIIWNYKFLGGVPTKQSAISTGFGTRFYFTKYISGNVMWTQPLTKQVLALQETSQVVVNGETVNRGNGSASRVFFSVVGAFDY